MSEYDTEPTIETLLARMASGFAQLNARFDQLVERLDRIERRMSHQDSKIDTFIEDVIDMKRQLRSTV